MVFPLFLAVGYVMTIGCIASGGPGTDLAVRLSLVVFGFGSPFLTAAVEFLLGAVVKFLVFDGLPLAAFSSFLTVRS